MSAQSGITPSAELVQAFADAPAQGVRCLIVSIENESLIVTSSFPIQSTFLDDLEKLQTVLEDDQPAYVLFQLDNSEGWLFISYVPDVAKVRPKMLYASTRSTLTRTLGDAKFVDSLYANHKNDLSPSGYEAHVRHTQSSHPMTEKEKELAEIKKAEGTVVRGTEERRAAWDIGSGGSGATLGLKWEEGTDEALRKVWENGGALYLNESIGVKLFTLGNMVEFNLPEKEPSYCFIRFDGKPEKELSTFADQFIVFIYSCPSTSPVKSRLLYSSSSSAVATSASNILGVKVGKKIETSDPSEITPSFVASELGLSDKPAAQAVMESKTTFAKPKRPGRK
ncbi:actin depolymerizing protein [Atractiella rhizophila]|nr:actin depolymerizing protein [Atractiella rhizophila]